MLVIDNKKGELYAKLVFSAYGLQQESVSKASSGGAFSDYGHARDHVVADFLRNGRHNGLVSCLLSRAFCAAGYRDIGYCSGVQIRGKNLKLRLITRINLPNNSVFHESITANLSFC